MKTLIKTIMKLFSAKCHKASRKLQVSNCIDLIDEHQVKLAKAYKNATKAIVDLENKCKTLREIAENEQNTEIKAIKQKNIDMLESTIARLKKSKERLATKIQNTEDSKSVLAAKKSLLDSIEAIKDISSNIFEKQEFDIDTIDAEIDQMVQSIEAELQADDELNDLISK